MHIDFWQRRFTAPTSIWLLTFPSPIGSFWQVFMAVSKAPRNVWKVRNKLGKKKERGTGLVILDTRCLGISPKIILNFAVSYTPVELDYIHIYIYIILIMNLGSLMYCTVRSWLEILRMWYMNWTKHPCHMMLSDMYVLFRPRCHMNVYIYTHVVGQEC